MREKREKKGRFANAACLFRYPECNQSWRDRFRVFGVFRGNRFARQMREKREKKGRFANAACLFRYPECNQSWRDRFRVFGVFRGNRFARQMREKREKKGRFANAACLSDLRRTTCTRETVFAYLA
jgi:hypothetical protein